MFYFAYGSNMNHQQMRTRCPEAKFLFRAVLESHSFVYDGWSLMHRGAVANIVPKKNGTVWGGVYETLEAHRDTLDNYEGYPSHYDRKGVSVVDDSRDLHAVFVYFRQGEAPGSPSDEYRQTVLRGARDCDLPEEYTEKFL